jgi:hypothetical protein
MRPVLLCFVVFDTLFLASNAASASYITVPGAASIWLAEQPNGTVIYQNTAPNESPVLVGTC